MKQQEIIQSTGMTLTTFVLGGQYLRNNDPYDMSFHDGFDLDDKLSLDQFKEEVSAQLSLCRFNMKHFRSESHDDDPDDLYQFTADQEGLTELFKQYLERLEERIKTWNEKDVCELRDMLNAYSSAVEDLEINHLIPFNSGIDMSNLPSMDIPSELTSYPVWAMDQQGHCLVGADAKDIEHIDEIRRKA